MQQPVPDKATMYVCKHTSCGIWFHDVDRTGRLMLRKYHFIGGNLMRYATFTNRSVFTNRFVYNVLAILITIAMLLLTAMPADAAGKKDKKKRVPHSGKGNVYLTIQAGDASAVSYCENVVRNGEDNLQDCLSDAWATGGSVHMEDVKIVAASRGGRRGAGDIYITIAAGDADATAYCANEIVDGEDNEQICTSYATAEGGDVTLTNVTIVAVAGGRRGR